MNASLKSLLVVGLFAVVFACVAGPACANEAADRVVKPGDLLSVAQRTNLMSGERVVGAVPKGQQIIVVEVRDNWVGTAVLLNKQTKMGWIKAKDLVGVGAPVAAQAASACDSLCSCCVELDDFLIGRIYRHEVDPNMHVWEPWRYR
jgi:hypothetical protein